MISVLATGSLVDERVLSRREMSQTAIGVHGKSEMREEKVDLEIVAVACETYQEESNYNLLEKQCVNILPQSS